LLGIGFERLTTTKVAERAGVSVGTFYQYFPNKDALLMAVLERHLLRVIELVESACSGAQDLSVKAMVDAVVDAFFAAKLENRSTSQALYSVSSDLGGESLVGVLTARSVRAVVDMLRSARDCHFGNPDLVGFMVSTAIITPVQALLARKASAAEFEAVRLQAKVMIAAYLEAAS
jgi:AcrR family transcriptional regulator